MIRSAEGGVAIEARNRRILVIDDNPGIHEDFRKILCPQMPTADALLQSEVAFFGEAQVPRAEAGFEMDSAFQGEEALKLLIEALEENRPYAMAFLDVRMPPGWMASRPRRESGNEIRICRSSSAPPTPTTPGKTCARGSGAAIGLSF